MEEKKEKCGNPMCNKNHNHLGQHWEEYYSPKTNMEEKAKEKGSIKE